MHNYSYGLSCLTIFTFQQQYSERSHLPHAQNNNSYNHIQCNLCYLLQVHIISQFKSMDLRPITMISTNNGIMQHILVIMNTCHIFHNELHYMSKYDNVQPTDPKHIQYVMSSNLMGLKIQTSLITKPHDGQWLQISCRRIK